VLLIFLAVCVVAFAVLVAIPLYISQSFLGRRFNPKQFAPEDYGIAAERIALKTDDGIALAAWRTRAETAKGTVVVISGIMNPSVTAYFGCAKMFADNGWDALLIEMRARGLSEGATTGLGMTEWLDVKAGVDFLSQDSVAKDLPIVAMGTSMGGSAVITATSEIPRIDAVMSLSAFASFSDMAVELLPNFGIPRFIAKIDKPFIHLVIGCRLGFGFLKYSPIRGIVKLGKRPLLLMHSTEDEQVPYSQFEKLLEAA
jgi:alpha-beta hydrolase superfamily lysophospholipase